MANVQFDEVRGDDWEWTVQILPDDGSDEPVTGLSAASAIEATMRRYIDSSVAISTTNITVVNDAEGYVLLEWASADTEDLQPGQYWCDIQFTVASKKRTAGPFAVRVRGDLTD